MDLGLLGYLWSKKQRNTRFLLNHSSLEKKINVSTRSYTGRALLHCLTLKYFHRKNSPGVFQIRDVNVSSCITGKTNIKHSKGSKEKRSQDSLHFLFWYNIAYCFRNNLQVYKQLASLKHLLNRKYILQVLHPNINPPLAHSQHIFKPRLKLRLSSKS